MGEDAGFAINGGKGWSNVEFNNHNVQLLGTTATAMGYYVFTDATSGDKVTVEYTTRRCRTTVADPIVRRIASRGCSAQRRPSRSRTGQTSIDSALPLCRAHGNRKRILCPSRQ